MTIRPRSFKARLVLTITAAFIAAGAALTVGQLLVLQAALNRNLSQVSVGTDGVVSVPTPAGTTMPQGSGPGVTLQWPSADCPSCAPVSAFPPGREGGHRRLWNLLAPGILRDAAIGGLLLLFGFALVTAFLAWWLARRALVRVGEVTALARQMSEHDLSRRMNLPGPRDEIRELADTIDVMLGRLQEAFDSQERFVANASHELRGPLTATRTALEAPLVQGRFPVEVAASVERALEANRRSERLITALLQLARSRAVERMESTPQDLAEIADQALQAVAEPAREQGVDLRPRIEAPVPLSGDATLLAQAVFNVVDNAVRHNHEGGRVMVTVSGTPTQARLTVENTGVEYTREEALQLREPFHRGRQSRLSVRDGRQGLGLGLSIVDAVAMAHHGRLVIAPRPQGGLTVELVLPVAG